MLLGTDISTLAGAVACISSTTHNMFDSQAPKPKAMSATSSAIFGMEINAHKKPVLPRVPPPVVPC